jgi:hypothetical protein
MYGAIKKGRGMGMGRGDSYTWAKNHAVGGV